MSRNSISYDKILQLTNSLEETLIFVESQAANNNVDFLIVIQSFIQQITFGLQNKLDLSAFIHFF
jgi:hypothetical protein